MGKTILYLRTDLCDEELTAGGSVAHTLGVIKGFHELGYSLVCASSCLDSVLQDLPIDEIVKLSNPSWLKFLRWKGNSFFSSFFFFFQARKLIKKYPVNTIYQRYSLLNMTGVLLAWWYKKPLLLEYNGSEVWVAAHWAKKRRLIAGTWLLALIEKINIRCADYLIVVSDVLRDEVIACGAVPEKVLVNPNGVDPQMFSPVQVVRTYEQHNCHPQRSVRIHEL